ncbi:hypothetical protein CSUI_006222 [Cystoisospora suis]|uniref:Transmembrane protein n=1 Tax=Cystoisospora suis TaxID=483139 RepID=A0A2C6KV84_9APIC|nr:hypothetical protein CSUI_006222 [Cystoisospora suis]
MPRCLYISIILSIYLPLLSLKFSPLHTYINKLRRRKHIYAPYHSLSSICLSLSACLFLIYLSILFLLDIYACSPDISAACLSSRVLYVYLSLFTTHMYLYI